METHVCNTLRDIFEALSPSQSASARENVQLALTQINKEQAQNIRKSLPTLLADFPDAVQDLHEVEEYLTAFIVDRPLPSLPSLNNVFELRSQLRQVSEPSRARVDPAALRKRYRALKRWQPPLLTGVPRLVCQTREMRNLAGILCAWRRGVRFRRTLVSRVQCILYMHYTQRTAGAFAELIKARIARPTGGIHVMELMLEKLALICTRRQQTLLAESASEAMHTLMLCGEDANLMRGQLTQYDPEEERTAALLRSLRIPLVRRFNEFAVAVSRMWKFQVKQMHLVKGLCSIKTRRLAQFFLEFRAHCELRAAQQNSCQLALNSMVTCITRGYAQKCFNRLRFDVARMASSRELGNPRLEEIRNEEVMLDHRVKTENALASVLTVLQQLSTTLKIKDWIISKRSLSYQDQAIKHLWDIKNYLGKHIHMHQVKTDDTLTQLQNQLSNHTRELTALEAQKLSLEQHLANIQLIPQSVLTRVSAENDELEQQLAELQEELLKCKQSYQAASYARFQP